MTDPAHDDAVPAPRDPGAEPPDDPVPAELLAASALGRPEVVALAGSVPTTAVSDVLGRLARRDERVDAGRRTDRHHVDRTGRRWADATHGPLVEWRRELDVLLTRADPAAVPDHLRPLVSGDAAELDRRVLADVDLARDLVDALGGDWAGGHHRRLLRAARVQVGLERPRATARRSVSGFTGASYPARPLRTVAAPVETLPVVHGRDELVARLVEATVERGGPTVVLVGDAGYGKTTTALAVARELADIPTLWVVAQDEPSLIDGLEQVAARLGATTRELEVARQGAPGRRARRLWTLIDRCDDREELPARWLLVIDDAGPDAVGRPEWLHRPRHGQVVITSRYGDEEAWGSDAEVVTMRRLDPEHGARVLLDVLTPAGRRLSTRVRAQARRASELLSGMPLALTSVGALLRSREGGALGALDDLVAGLGRRPHATALESAYETCLDALGDASAGPARRLLRLLSCFAPDEQLPRRVVSVAPEAAWTDPGGDGLDALVRVGLVEERRVGDEVALLVQTAVAEHSRRDPTFDVDEVAALDLRAVALLAAEVAVLDPGAPRDWPAVSALEPHVAEVLESPALTSPADAERALRLADQASEGLMRVGDHTTATTLLDRALARFSVLGADHPAVLAARRTRAWMVALDGGGDLQRAGQLLVELLAETRDVLGHDDLTTLAVQDCLGWVRVEQGDLVGGSELLDGVLHHRRRVLGDADPLTLATRHRLGWITAERGHPARASQSLTDVLRARQQLLGDHHLDVFSTRYRLAWALNEQGRHAESVRMYGELSDDIEAVLGRDHPLTLMVRGRLAWGLSWLNRFDEAEAVYEALLVDQQKVLGVDHPRVFTTAHYQAMLWLRRGRMVDAEAAFREVGDRREEVLGADHPLTLYTRSYHAWARFLLGDTDGADRELAAVFADRVGVLGERHPHTLTTRYLQARVLMHRGHLVDAERRLRELLDDMVGQFAPDHRQVLHVQVALAVTVGFQDNIVEAEEMLRGVVADRTRTLGAEHRETLTARDQLAWAVGRGRRLDEAAIVCAETLEVRARTLGVDHPATLTSRYREAWIVLRRGRHRDARALFARLLADLRRAVGDRHPDTLRARTRYVETLRLCGSLDEASSEVASLVADLGATLGEDAVETMRGHEEQGRLALARGDRHTARRIMLQVLERRRRVLGEDHSDMLRSVEDVDGLG